MSEEKIIEESELDDLLEEAKGDSAEPVVEIPKEKVVEPEIEIELETGEQEKIVEPVNENEGIELEVEEEPKTEQKMVVDPEIVSAHTPKQIQQSTQTIQSVVAQTGLVAPVCSVQESVRIFKEFEQAKSKILTGNDVLWIGDDGRPAIEGQGSPHIKRSGWRKLARFFGLSWDIEDIKKLAMENGGYMYKVRVKVWHPAGASIVAEGLASSRDKFFTKGNRIESAEENIIMKAETVAINRAISDILGSGDVSGEETD